MNKETSEKRALVTGAGQGLGKAIVHELASRGFGIILVSLPGENLPSLSKEITDRYGVETDFYETDLSVTANVKALAAWVNERYQLFILVNNAGLGGSGSFTEVSPDYINTIIQVNVAATSMLTRLLLPNLMQCTESFILNVSSMAAFTPTGYKTVYPASKSFVHSFSRGLNAELRNRGVFVSVVNPGAMKTSAEITARIEKQGLLGRLTLLHPEKVARRCIDGLLQRDSVIMVNPVSWLIVSLIPIWIKLPLMTKAVRREICA